MKAFTENHSIEFLQENYGQATPAKDRGRAESQTSPGGSGDQSQTTGEMMTCPAKERHNRPAEQPLSIQPFRLRVTMNVMADEAG
jgi:hypothetical protein